MRVRIRREARAALPADPVGKPASWIDSRCPSEMDVQTAAKDIGIKGHIAVCRQTAIETTIEVGKIDEEVFGLDIPMVVHRPFETAANGPAGPLIRVAGAPESTERAGIAGVKSLPSENR